jgi:hypothetical protein
MARSLTCVNANVTGIAFEKRRRVIAAFSELVQPDDTRKMVPSSSCVFPLPFSLRFNRFSLGGEQALSFRSYRMPP